MNFTCGQTLLCFFFSFAELSPSDSETLVIITQIIIIIIIFIYFNYDYYHLIVTVCSGVPISVEGDLPPEEANPASVQLSSLEAIPSRSLQRGAVQKTTVVTKRLCLAVSTWLFCHSIKVAVKADAHNEERQGKGWGSVIKRYF